VKRRSGDEAFTSGGRPLDASVLDFWRWSASDLVDNATRGVLAEFIVGLAVDAGQGVRGSWDAYDLRSPSGIKIEVKSASVWQTWYQKQPSRLTFGVRPTSGWDPDTGDYEEEARRQADVYVFAVLETSDKMQLDPLNLDQWKFYVLPARTLDEHLGAQKRVGLARIIELGGRECAFGDLGSTIEGVV
jgi:hypothetical protein